MQIHGPLQETLRQMRRHRIDGWLDEGGTVLAASERAARALLAEYAEAREAEGRFAWRTPAIFSWDSWLQDQWRKRDSDGKLLLNALQEKSLWMQEIASSRRGRGLLHGGRLAVASQRAYRLICDYAPEARQPSARLGWQGDAAVFSQWMESFDGRCLREGFVSPSCLAGDLAEILADERVQSLREQLLLVGFDRLLPSQQALLHAWGPWQEDEAQKTAPVQEFLVAQDASSEISACVDWLRAGLRANPEGRLMVVVTNPEGRRGELERALRRGSEPELDFEFSMGLPLGQMSHARAALLLLRWLHESLSEAEVDWLLSSGLCFADAGEEIALVEGMHLIRRRGRERPGWSLEEFRAELRGGERDRWAARMLGAQEMFSSMAARRHPLEWVGAARQLLEAMGWPGYRPLSSVAFQVRERWERVLDDCGSLGFQEAPRGVSWQELTSPLADAVSETVFAAESSDARIQITGPLESAGQLADGIWFLGTDEDAWPGRGQPNPLLPIGLQRDAGMPHASPQADWSLAEQATGRLLASAEEVVFSYASQSSVSEARPSRLAVRLLGAPREIPRDRTRSRETDRTERFADLSQIAFPHDEVRGGAAMLTDQSNCPFKAFATARLAVEEWQRAEAGLNAKQRGILLHAVLHRVWASAAQGGIATLGELQAIPSLRDFVAHHVSRTMREAFAPQRRNAIPDRFPARYLELEAERLTRLVVEWLTYERTRLPFAVSATEVASEVTIAGLRLRLRLDRIDTVADGGRLVVDYKSSEVGPKMWAGERPENLQLPLYAAYAIDGNTDRLEGLAIAQVRAGKPALSGQVRNAGSTLFAGLTRSNGLVKNPLTDEQLADWRLQIERLAEDFVAGHAEVDPREPGKTCERCCLQAVCRISENDPLAALETEDEPESAGGQDE